MKTIHRRYMGGPTPAAQRGVGMFEVLVAMLLLAIGVLGYAALQVRAVEATSEALNRSQALVILRGLAESIRVNGDVTSTTNASGVVSSTNNQQGYATAVHNYAGITSSTTAPATCVAASATDTVSCTAAALTTYDAYQTASTALGLGIHVDMYNCPGATQTPIRQCLVAAWGKTNPVISSAPVTTDCMDTSGVYVSGSTCLMMEAY